MPHALQAEGSAAGTQARTQVFDARGRKAQKERQVITCSASCRMVRAPERGDVSGGRADLVAGERFDSIEPLRKPCPLEVAADFCFVNARNAGQELDIRHFFQRPRGIRKHLREVQREPLASPIAIVPRRPARVRATSLPAFRAEC